LFVQLEQAGFDELSDYEVGFLVVCSLLSGVVGILLQLVDLVLLVLEPRLLQQGLILGILDFSLGAPSL
jgi:hypothetical protein